jgi:hypothetical protein
VSLLAAAQWADFKSIRDELGLGSEARRRYGLGAAITLAPTRVG